MSVNIGAVPSVGYKSYRNLHAAGTSWTTTTQTILSVTGSGTLKNLTVGNNVASGDNLNLSVILDGVTIYNSTLGFSSYSFRFWADAQNKIMAWNSTSPPYYVPLELPFKQSLVIQVSTSNANSYSNAFIDVGYEA